MASKSKAMPQPRRSAWLELYTAQKKRIPQIEQVGNVGRPARVVSLQSMHTQISEADKDLLIEWQKKIKTIEGKGLTLGEVAGLLAHIVTARMTVLGLQDENPENLEYLINRLIGEAS
jgi:hypothetical protein